MAVGISCPVRKGLYPKENGVRGQTSSKGSRKAAHRPQSVPYEQPCPTWYSYSHPCRAWGLEGAYPGSGGVGGMDFCSFIFTHTESLSLQPPTVKLPWKPSGAESQGGKAPRHQGASVFQRKARHRPLRQRRRQDQGCRASSEASFHTDESQALSPALFSAAAGVWLPHNKGT